MTPRLETVEEIFHAALDCSPDQLKAFLDKRCAGDEVLRGKVEQLLAAHRKAGTFIETPVANPTGSKFGDFEIARREDGSLWELGRGGMGATYRARDSVLHRSVALKVIEVPPGAEDSEVLRERFLREARAAAALRHPNVAAVYQFGTVPEPNRCYYAMELVEGETLDARVRREGPLKVTQVLEIAVQVTRALIAAANQGLIHRDLKPGNIMLTRSEDSRAALEVKVIDFGLAKVTAESLGEMDLTHGGFVGTPSYASPEQFAGGRVDARSDIYSLGASLWFALTGRLPCAGTNLEEIRRCQKEAPLPVQQLVARKVPAPVVALLRSMLAVDPDERPTSARELMEEIENCRAKLIGGNETRHSFFGELQRRNVYKVAAAYAIVGWLLVQIATQVFPFLEIPAWAVRLVIVLVAIGFPIALVLAWAFELTPEGIKRTTEVAPAESIRRLTGRKIAFVVIAIFAMVTGLLLFNRYRPGKTPPVSSVAQKSIAVLPFQNLSADQENAYFADGIQEEILTRLSKVADLKVISRSSTQRYKSASRGLREIAKQLDVAHVLEGSVQKAADHVRVNVQLINAQTDSHLWAEKYDRKLTDIFAVETEIATKIAETLQAKLTGLEQRTIAASQTQDAEAHELYLKGRFFFAKRTGDDLKKAISFFEQALARDPKYALAYAGLADAYAILPGHAGGSANEAIAKARAAAEKALVIDNDLAEAHSALGWAFAADFDLQPARREFERAIELNPNYAIAHYTLGFNVLGPLGEFDSAIAEMERAVKLDPLSAAMAGSLAYCYVFARRYSEAIATARKAIELEPRKAIGHDMLALGLELTGHVEEAIAEFERSVEASGGDLHPLTWLSHLYAMRGDRAKALETFEKAKRAEQKQAVEWAYGHGLVNIGLGNHEEAINWLERSYETKENPVITYIEADPLLDPLRGNPRFERLARQIASDLNRNAQLPPPQKSIAVLPFENLSDDPANAYFATGIQEEILTRLSKIADLKVISRSSTQRYKSASRDLREIAKQLNVAHVLEGSVQKAADQVRVNVQLINAQTDAHLWADKYDRKLTDIFAVESEIAAKVAENLRAKLTGSEQTAIAVRPTEDPEAHELYLKARYVFARRTHEDTLKAIDYYSQAIAKDPNYAAAYAGLAESYVLLPVFSRVPASEVHEKAKNAAEKAVSIDNDLAEAHASLGVVMLFTDLNFKEARREFERAIALNPNYPEVYYFLAALFSSLGQFDAAITELKRGLELDPLSSIMRTSLARCYVLERRFAEAIDFLHKTIELNPAYGQASDVLAIALGLSGNLDGAIAQFQKTFQSTGGDFHCVVYSAHFYGLKGEREKALEALERGKRLQQQIGAEWAYGYAVAFAGIGDKDQALEWLERSYQAKEYWLLLQIKVDPLLASLRGEPRFEKLANQILPGDPDRRP
jgi:TolB-like protein/Tfp pilus assembly protein PilF